MCIKYISLSTALCLAYVACKAQGDGNRPRGDDPRVRSWSTALEDGSGIIKFDDPKSPRWIGFVGLTPNMRTYPNYSDPNVYIQLQISTIQELDAQGRGLPERDVSGLAVPDGFSLTTAVFSFDGFKLNATSLNATVDPRKAAGYQPICNIPCNGNQCSPSPPSSRSEFGVNLLFGFHEVTNVPFGANGTVVVPRNGQTWAVTMENWPFCNLNNSVSMTMFLLLPGNIPRVVKKTDSTDGIQTLTVDFGYYYTATLTLYSYALNAADGTIKMPVNVNINTDAQNTSLRLIFPNPARYNASRMYYICNMTTTNSFLAANDPGNGYLLPLEEGENAAPILRSSVWAALLGAALSALWLLA